MHRVAVHSNHQQATPRAKQAAHWEKSHHIFIVHFDCDPDRHDYTLKWSKFVAQTKKWRMSVIPCLKGVLLLFTVLRQTDTPVVI